MCAETALTSTLSRALGEPAISAQTTSRDTVPPCLTAEIAIGLLGCGGIASYYHLPALAAHPDARIVAVADPAPEARNRARGIVPGIAVEADPRAVLERSDIDAVVICAENARHADLARAAAEARKHLYLEKPLALTVADGRAVVEAVQTAGVNGTIGFNLRFHPLRRRPTLCSNRGRWARCGPCERSSTSRRGAAGCPSGGGVAPRAAARCSTSRRTRSTCSAGTWAARARTRLRGSSRTGPSTTPRGCASRWRRPLKPTSTADSGPRAPTYSRWRARRGRCV